MIKILPIIILYRNAIYKSDEDSNRWLEADHIGPGGNIQNTILIKLEIRVVYTDERCVTYT